MSISRAFPAATPCQRVSRWRTVPGLGGKHEGPGACCCNSGGDVVLVMGLKIIQRLRLHSSNTCLHSPLQPFPSIKGAIKKAGCRALANLDPPVALPLRTEHLEERGSRTRTHGGAALHERGRSPLGCSVCTYQGTPFHRLGGCSASCPGFSLHAQYFYLSISAGPHSLPATAQWEPAY